MVSRSLWNKAWLDTRWRFITGVVLLTLLAAGKIFEFVATDRLLPQLNSTVLSSNASGVVAAILRDVVMILACIGVVGALALGYFFMRRG